MTKKNSKVDEVVADLNNAMNKLPGEMTVLDWMGIGLALNELIKLAKMGEEYVKKQ